MTARGAIVLLLLGLAIGIVGNMFRLQHWPYAGALTIGATTIQAIAVFVLIIKVSRYPGFKDFLDS
ncbi:MAG TPA: gliding motility protein GldL [Flavobacteriales bacterium]|nr:gliding motility protein GldL [Flavobacteriales bacterium]HNU55850.1 gliding motility protein GldL [Flavobacteriales bacterium]